MNCGYYIKLFRYAYLVVIFLENVFKSANDCVTQIIANDRGCLGKKYKFIFYWMNTTWTFGTRFNSLKQSCTVQFMAVQVVAKITALDNFIFFHFPMLTYSPQERSRKKALTKFGRRKGLCPSNCPSKCPSHLLSTFWLKLLSAITFVWFSEINHYW